MTFNLLISFFALFTFFNTPDPHPKEQRLSGPEIKSLFYQNTIRTTFSNSDTEAFLFFDGDGKVYLSKGNPLSSIYYGRWEVKQNYLETPWPLYDYSSDPTSKYQFYKERDLQTYLLEIYQLSDSLYQPYRPNTCSCDASPPKLFPTFTIESSK